MLKYNVFYTLQDVQAQAEECGCLYWSPDTVAFFKSKTVFFAPTFLDVSNQDGCIGYIIERQKPWGENKNMYYVKEVNLSRDGLKVILSMNTIGIEGKDSWVGYSTLEKAKRAIKNIVQKASKSVS